MEKTIDDVTKEQWSNLTDAAIDLLGAARMMCWLLGKEKDEDPSFRDSIATMECSLDAIGLNQGTTEEFIVNLEVILHSGAMPQV